MAEPIQTTRMRRLPTIFGVFTTFSDEILDVKRFAQVNWLKSLTLEGKCLRRRAKPAHLGGHLPPGQCRFPGTLSAGTRFCADGQATSSATTGSMAGPGSPEFFGGTPRICCWHQARLRRRSSSVVSSLESGAGGGTDHTPETAEEANVRAGSLRAPSLACPLHSLIQPSHKVRMSVRFVPSKQVATPGDEGEGGNSLTT
jgi:hypothetical protein